MELVAKIDFFSTLRISISTSDAYYNFSTGIDAFRKDTFPEMTKLPECDFNISKKGYVSFLPECMLPGVSSKIPPANPSQISGEVCSEVPSGIPLSYLVLIGLAISCI